MISDILFELRTGRGVWWTTTLEQAFRLASEKIAPKSITILYLSHVARITAGEVISL